MQHPKNKCDTDPYARAGILVSKCIWMIAIWTFIASGPSIADQTNSSTAKFTSELNDAGLVFHEDLFTNFSVARVLPNNHFEYHYALKHNSLPFEIRFSFREVPVAEGMDPQVMAGSLVWASIANMARKENGEPLMANPNPFPPDAVKREFGADWGVTAAFAPDPTFAKYDGGLANAFLLKETSTVGYVVYLFDEAPSGGPSDEIADEMRHVFHGLEFRR